ncbi:protease modulator HflC [Paracoccus sp. S-4012]|uniref:protease modulator HflC n=1 Tax=Paracoccus sp. S-4012 TaxID=2665648 RepID=UPI0012B13E31|nr:protease modulator HflC [Paracoccus sp. S-4012]MRX51164.1 protease modulator HflC [Paracoccus sp. S-4012]
MRRTLSALALPLVIVVAGLVLAAIYIVDIRQTAIVLRFGEVVAVRNEPGLGFKLPLIDRVVKYDARILGLPTEPMEVTPADDRRLVVDAFARWRITDAVRFRRAVGNGGITFAEQRLSGIMTNAIRGVLGSVPSTAVLSQDRTALMNQIRDAARDEAEALGVTVIDVRLTRTDLPQQNLEATYARMRAEREREAADERARGGEAAQRVRATADRTVVEVTSDARRRAEVVRGEADAQRNAIYAEAFGQDPEFFNFTRSMTAYERALQGGTSSLVMQPDGEFFSYLRDDSPASTMPAGTGPRPMPLVEEASAEAEATAEAAAPPVAAEVTAKPVEETAGSDAASQPPPAPTGAATDPVAPALGGEGTTVPLPSEQSLIPEETAPAVAEPVATETVTTAVPVNPPAAAAD